MKLTIIAKIRETQTRFLQPTRSECNRPPIGTRKDKEGCVWDCECMYSSKFNKIKKNPCVCDPAVCIFFSADFQCPSEMHLLIDEQWSNDKKNLPTCSQSLNPS